MSLRHLHVVIQVNISGDNLGTVLKQCHADTLPTSELVLSLGLYNGSSPGATPAASISIPESHVPAALGSLVAENFHYIWPPRAATGMRDPGLTVSDVVEVVPAEKGPNAGLQVRSREVFMAHACMRR